MDIKCNERLSEGLLIQQVKRGCANYESEGRWFESYATPHGANIRTNRTIQSITIGLECNRNCGIRWHPLGDATSSCIILNFKAIKGLVFCKKRGAF